MKQHSKKRKAALHEAYEQYFDKPGALFEFTFDEQALAFELAIDNPTLDKEPYAVITSLGLSDGIEFTLDIEKKISQKEAAEIAGVYVALLPLLESEEEIVPGTIYHIPSSVAGMDAVMIDNGEQGYPEWLDEENESGRMVRVIPIFTQEATDLEQFTPDLRSKLIKESEIAYKDPAREPAQIARQAFMSVWGNISTWYTEHEADCAGLLEKTLNSTANNNAADALEAKLGLTLPADFKFSFNMPHAKVALGAYVLRDVDEIMEDWSDMNKRKRAGEFKAATKKMRALNDRSEREWWREEWIPIAYNATNGDRLLLSVVPEPDSVGRIIEFEVGNGPQSAVFKTFFEYLIYYNRVLHEGKFEVAGGRVVKPEWTRYMGCDRYIGKPDALLEFKFEEQALAFELAIRNPDSDLGVDDTAILSLGLSTDIELMVEVDKEEISPDEAAEIAGLYVTVLKLLESEAEIVPGTIYRIPTPVYGMSAVMITDGPDGYPSWLDDKNESIRIIWIIPLFAEEATDLEKFTHELRLELVERSEIAYRDPDREPAQIAQLAFMTIWGRISTWYTENGVESADLLANILESEEKGNAADVLEEKLGLTLPADFKLSFNMPHAKITLGEYVLQDVDDIVEDWSSMNKIKREGDGFKAGVKKMKSYGDRTETEWWREEWIPIARNGSNGDMLLLSLAPSPDGIVRLIEFQIHEGPLATNFTSFFEYLRDYAEDLENDTYEVADWGGLTKE